MDVVTNIVFFLIALAAGIAMSVQAAANGQLAGGMGGNTIAAAFYSFFSGTIVLALIALARGGLTTSLSVLPGQPWWRLIGGLLGAGAISSTVLLAPRIGLANLLVLVIAGQLLSSLAIDHYGILGVPLRPITTIKLLGAAIMIAGVLLTLFGDRIAKLMSGQILS